MRALKFLVIAMGVLIVAGIGVIAVTIADRSADSVTGAATEVKVDIPPGSRVVETSLDGDRLALRLVLADGTTRVLVLDTATGRDVARVELREAVKE